ncbi:hypothetical protein H1R20_g12648, partial [Candolleomyces eurysporus]
MMNEECSLWNTVFFKVEDTIFQVPQHRFTEHSEVFADMFLLPQAGDAESVEGKDKEHPIRLESYKAADFKALVKLLYPLPAISDSYSLTKDEWVGVLNLSTRWHMRKMRDYAISNLSKMSLTSIEKVTLARDHEVAKWLKEGLNEIVNNKNGLKPDELKCHLGLETAFRLMWIQNQSLNGTPVQSGVVMLKALGCSEMSCASAMFKVPQNCIGCSRRILPDDPEAIYLCHNASVLVRDVSTSGPARTQFLVKLADLRCRYCLVCPLVCHPNSGYGCASSSCDNIVCGAGSFSLLLGDGAPQKAKSDQNIDEVFKEEIASYESWDQ